MEHRPLQGNQFSASQETPRILWEPESSLPLKQVPATCPYPESYQPIPMVDSGDGILRALKDMRANFLNYFIVIQIKLSATH